MIRSTAAVVPMNPVISLLCIPSTSVLYKVEGTQYKSVVFQNMMLGCGSFVRNRKRKKVDSRPYLYRQGVKKHTGEAS